MGGSRFTKNLQDIFSGSGESDGSVAEEYDVDEKNNHSKVLLLLNQADSSQLSSIIDVMDGKNIAHKVLLVLKNQKQ